MSNFRGSVQMQAFLNGVSAGIISWYNDNVDVVKNQVEQAEAEGDYALALAILGSVPEQATTAYKYVSRKRPKTQTALCRKQAAEMLGEMEALIASSGDNFNPAVGAYFSLIPMNSREHTKAKKMYAEYKKKCDSRRTALELKSKNDESAARELQKLQMLYDHEEELAQMEVKKVEAKWTARATAAAARRQPRGFFGSIGYAITRTTDRIYDGL